ncbi:MAG: HU family DNA-binding protein [Planctomycetes bacterium]|nr:HU family DNA-binding protein [Planctomycetota bacterium]
MNKVKSATKSEIFLELAKRTDLSRKQVALVFDELANYIKQQVGKKGSGIFTVPGLLKIKRVEKPATKERMGRNPQTGETIMIKAKPKRTVVKAYPLKALKEMVL